MSISPTIAEKLHNKPVTKEPINYEFDRGTAVFKFSDNSLAIIIIRYEDCEPYQAKSTTTMSKRAVKYWKAL